MPFSFLRPGRAAAALLLILLAGGPAVAQTASPPPATLTQEPPPAATTVPPAIASGPRPTLLPNPGDPVDVDDVILPEKPAAILSGTSTWDDGFANLRAAFSRIEGALGAAGIRPAGRPVVAFVQSDDVSFQYQAMIPLERAPETMPTLPPGMRIGTTPSGRAFRFVHKGPYDDIDSTYETITTYLDAKSITAKDSFIEEYASDAKDAADPSLEVNIFVQPR